jgi:hypothetical protein
MSSSAQPADHGTTSVSATWARLLAVSWILVAAATGITATASARTGKSLWWVNGSVAANVAFSVIFYAVFVAMIRLAMKRSGRAPLAGAVVALLLGASAALDLGRAGGSALVVVALSGAGLLASIAAFAGRQNHN